MATLLKPFAAPVPVEQVKAYLRIAGSDEDALIAGMIRSATELCEAFTRLALIAREVEEALPPRAVWTRLACAPVRSISGVAAIGQGGGETPLQASDYAIDIDGAGDGWVRILRCEAARVLVRYEAGLGADWNAVPEPLRQGIVRMAAHLYACRDGEDGRGPPAAVTALWLPYRRLRLS